MWYFCPQPYPPGFPGNASNYVMNPPTPSEQPALGNAEKRCTIPNTMGAQKQLKINPRQLKMEKLVSSKSVNLTAKIQYEVHFSSKIK